MVVEAVLEMAEVLPEVGVGVAVEVEVMAGVGKVVVAVGVVVGWVVVVAGALVTVALVALVMAGAVRMVGARVGAAAGAVGAVAGVVGVVMMVAAWVGAGLEVVGVVEESVVVYLARQGLGPLVVVAVEVAVHLVVAHQVVALGAVEMAVVLRGQKGLRGCWKAVVAQAASHHRAQKLPPLAHLEGIVVGPPREGCRSLAFCIPHP